ncbi:hypothetical protein CTAYLR_003915 [Chrysophaeum taylorii]|uniref:Uncharacterized protein n=1 Tax=Chrysophaeum taylorii TaxID=2483200 RepID=A0AAD7U9E5_9STRA|nr:hypothetical protein CTAYLR_003915 [Chrysophaeum taylorii]
MDFRLLSMQRWRTRRVRRRRLRAGDDATEGLIWLVARGCIAFVDLHAVGAVTVVIKGVGLVDQHVPWLAAFSPFFAASLVALVTQIRVFARAASLKLHNPAVHYGAVSAANARGDVIHEDALPLVRRGIVAIVLSVPTLAVVATAQILSCVATAAFASGHRRRARVAASRATACLLSLETAALCAAVALKGRGTSEPPASKLLSVAALEDEPQCLRRSRSRLSGRLGVTFHVLLWLWLVLLVALLDDPTLTRRHAEHPTIEQRLSRASTPLWLAWVLLVSSLAVVCRRHRARVYRLQCTQLVSAGLYVFSCSCLAAAVAARFGFPFAERAGRASLARVRPAAPGLAALGIVAAAAALHLAFLRHAQQLAHSRGHGAPLPLARTPEGYWGVSGSGESFWFLLGSFERFAQPDAPSLLSMSACSHRWCVSACRGDEAPDATMKSCASCSKCSSNVAPRPRCDDDDDDAVEDPPPLSISSDAPRFSSSDGPPPLISPVIAARRRVAESKREAPTVVQGEIKPYLTSDDAAIVVPELRPLGRNYV